MDCMNMTRAVPAVIALVTLATAAPAQVPSTDIFLIPVDGDAVGAPRRVTDREGYDNQPRFLPDGKSLVYSSMRDGGTDIYLYDLVSGKTHAIVETPESEYSPTPVPGRNAISLVRDYGDLKQQLWSFPLDGGEPELLLPDVNPVGYHAWVDEQSLLLFVLGEPMTLQAASVGPGEGRVLAASPGRALARKTGARALRAVLDEIMLDIMYDLPDTDSTGVTYIIDADVIESGRPLSEIPQRKAKESA